MKHDKLERRELLIAGLGGMGVLVAGQVLLEAAFHSHQYVSYISSYGFARRGGLCECTVIFSNDEIASPLLDQAQVVMLLDNSQFGSFKHRVRTGGVIIAEKAGLGADIRGEGYKLYALPGLEIAVKMGASVINNLIMLGAYVAITESVSPELIGGELKRRYGDSGSAMARNLEAFQRGLKLGRSAE